MKLVIGHLYPDLLNLYGDRGNIQCFVKRLEWRGIEAEVIPYLSGDEIDFSALDIILLGGGSDREQEIVCAYLKEIKAEFIDYVEQGGVVLAVCGGYQLLGKYYKTKEKTIEGLGIVDISTKWEEKRLVDNIVLKSELFDMPVTGFENHGGRTDIGSCTPFGKVLYGNGNDEKSEYEGIVYKNVIGTYLHGPLLPKNPQICDYLLERALQKKYGEEVRLKELPDEMEKNANDYIVKTYADML
ncbi:CobQ-like glutamine amidotransferase family enzyme [Aequitasia blattaphilus]|uniref:Lipid II isoglutaminyl synthase (glutamine-hydrolyzing) subunit GatD n=1 Tax=Aequitasia blattaphilus TaxID=2949332 RepID=A0ABT1ECJ4_9FIRM|nr:glutamine amidotransferase [Aequitasia blattaphilus]MCP1103391.1 glutamine amidotransferase [Aequitasia blattaphilus]MCR8616031.1 glutamine amidotransferase [Aequitasia blattaphilus]